MQPKDNLQNSSQGLETKKKNIFWPTFWSAHVYSVLNIVLLFLIDFILRSGLTYGIFILFCIFLSIPSFLIHKIILQHKTSSIGFFFGYLATYCYLLLVFFLIYFIYLSIAFLFLDGFIWGVSQIGN